MLKETTKKTRQSKPSFWEALQQLPRVLLLEVLKRVGTFFVTLLLTIFMLCIEQDWMYCIGFVISLCVLYLSLDIVIKYRNGQIYVARMIVSKTQKNWRRKSRIRTILRSANIKDVTSQEIVETYQYDLPVTLRNKGMITPGTVLDIYFYESSPHTILAYEVLGETLA